MGLPSAGHLLWVPAPDVPGLASGPRGAMDRQVSVLLRALAGVQPGQASSPPQHPALWGLWSHASLLFPPWVSSQPAGLMN